MFCNIQIVNWKYIMQLNFFVLERRQKFSKTLKKKKSLIGGYILQHNSLTKRVIEGKIEGRNCKERPCLEFMTKVMQDINCDYMSYNRN